MRGCCSPQHSPLYSQEGCQLLQLDQADNRHRCSVCIHHLKIWIQVLKAVSVLESINTAAAFAGQSSTDTLSGTALCACVAQKTLLLSHTWTYSRHISDSLYITTAAVMQGSKLPATRNTLIHAFHLLI